MPSKYTKRLRRGSLTTKSGNVQYYKGVGARTEGVHGGRGGFTLLPSRLLDIQAPDGTCSVRGRGRELPPTDAAGLALLTLSLAGSRSAPPPPSLRS